MTLLFLILGLATLLFVAIPPLKTVISSGPEVLGETLLDPEVYNSVLLTICGALVASLVGLVLGVPAAYLLARHQFRGKRAIEGIIDVPIVIPHSAAGVALLFAFGRQSFAGQMFESVGIHFFGTFAGIVLAMMFVSIPFLLDSCKEGFETVDVRLERVARTLGASPWQTFTHVSLPLARRSILAGFVMMWARGMSEFGAVVIIAYHVPFFGNMPTVLPILVSDRFAYGMEYARPVAAIGIFVALVCFAALRTFAGREERE